MPSLRPTAPSDVLVRARSRFDASRWPLVRLAYPSQPSVEEIAAFYTIWESYLDRGKHAALIDLTDFNPLAGDAVFRKRVADEIERRRDAFEQFLVAEVRVITNPVVRGIVTAFDWMVGSKFSRPLKNVSSFAEAEDFLTMTLVHCGFEVPPPK